MKKSLSKLVGLIISVIVLLSLLAEGVKSGNFTHWVVQNAGTLESQGDKVQTQTDAILQDSK